MASERILLVGKVEEGEIHYDISPLPASDGDIQRLIDEAAELEEYEEDMLDREFWASGNW